MENFETLGDMVRRLGDKSSGTKQTETEPREFRRTRGDIPTLLERYMTESDQPARPVSQATAENQARFARRIHSLLATPTTAMDKHVRAAKRFTDITGIQKRR